MGLERQPGRIHPFMLERQMGLEPTPGRWRRPAGFEGLCANHYTTAAFEHLHRWPDWFASPVELALRGWRPHTWRARLHRKPVC